MKIKTNALTGPALDWAVAQTDRYEVDVIEGIVYLQDHSKSRVTCNYNPSVNWGWGGPIIERERMWVCAGASTPGWFAESQATRQRGPSPLIAAMRCFVASKLGDEVEVPDELA